VSVKTTFSSTNPRDDLPWEALQAGRIYLGNGSGAIYLIVEVYVEGGENQKTAIVVHHEGHSAPDFKWAAPQGGTFTEVFGKLTLEFVQ